MKNLEKVKLDLLLTELKEGANELLNYGNSSEKSEGKGMLEVIEQVSELMGCTIEVINYKMFRHIRFFLYNYTCGKLPKVNIYMRLYDIIDGPGDGKKICFSNLEKYFLDIYFMVHSKIKYDEIDIVAEDIVNLLNKK
jgi:hypothetical protein